MPNMTLEAQQTLVACEQMLMRLSMESRLQVLQQLAHLRHRQKADTPDPRQLTFDEKVPNESP